MSSENFHVSSSLNRASITAYGLDWRRMGYAPGIAGSREPEVEGCFIARGAYECRWFARMNNTGGPVDVWQVDDIDFSQLQTSMQGYLFYAGTISPDRLTLVQRDIALGTVDLQRRAHRRINDDLRCGNFATQSKVPTSTPSAIFPSTDADYSSSMRALRIQLLVAGLAALLTTSCSTLDLGAEPDSVAYRPPIARVAPAPDCLAGNIYAELTGLGQPGTGPTSDAPEPGYPPPNFDSVAVLRCERRTDDAGALTVDSVRLEGDIAAVDAAFSAQSQRFPDGVMASCAYESRPPVGLWLVDAAGEAFRPAWPTTPCGLQNEPLVALSDLVEVSRSSYPTGYVNRYNTTCQSNSDATVFETTTADDVSAAEERERTQESFVIPSLVMPIDDVDALQLCIYPSVAVEQPYEVGNSVAGTRLDLSRSQSAAMVRSVADAPLAPPCNQSSSRIASTQLRRPDGSGQALVSLELDGCQRATGFGYYRAIPSDVIATLTQA